MIASAAKTGFALISAAMLLAACAAQQVSAPQTQITTPARTQRTLPRATPEIPSPPIGADEAAIRAEYGAPDFVRNEPDSQLWRYDGSNCALFFFLYQEAGSYVLRHAESAPAGEDDTVDAACITAIKQRRAPSS